jgi:hypothetical protein
VLRATATGLLVLMSSLLGTAAAAQDASARAAYRALTQTPSGALPGTLGASVLGSERGAWSLRLRYGLMSFDDEEYVHNFGIGGDIHLGAGRVGLTLGAYHPACGDEVCPGHFMSALTFSERLVGARLGRPSSSATLNLGLDVTAGLGAPSGSTLYAGSVSLPISIVSDTSGFRFVPYVAPGLGTGLVRGDGATDAGIRGTFGAGVGLLGLLDGFALNAELKRVFLEGGNWLVGFGLSYGS